MARSLSLVLAVGGLLAVTLGVRTAAQGWGFGSGPQEEMKVVERFDTDGDKRLNAAERRAARAARRRLGTRPGRMGVGSCPARRRGRR